jgi:hypothetical protein
MVSDLISKVLRGMRIGAYLGGLLFFGLTLLFVFDEPLSVVLQGCLSALFTGVLHGALWGAIFSVAIFIDKGFPPKQAKNRRKWIRTGVSFGSLIGLILGIAISIMAQDFRHLLQNVSLAIIGGLSVGILWGIFVRLIYKGASSN